MAGEGSPYRSGTSSEPRGAAREDGIVDDLIRQFADPLAFYRELVQNSIDAGATRIVVRIGWDPEPPAEEKDPGGVLTVSVRDDGSGMGRDVLENQLTVLFRSGKEGQEGKIGKFGIGFVSVLALGPRLVEVRSSEGKGEQWTLHLFGDQTYELFRAPGGGQAGTTVSLQVDKRRSEVEAFVAGSERALTRWCRHAEIPIQLVASVGGGAEPLRQARIDRPLGLPEALVSVEAEQGGTRVVAGLPRDGRPYLGFFNRGLLLHETAQDLLGPVVVVIQDGRLEHTLSRDNVRRDAAYERAIRFARDVVEGRLTAHVRGLLPKVAAGTEPSPPLDALLEATLAAGLAVDEESLRLPTIEAGGARGTIDVARLRRGGCTIAAARDALTERMSEAGVPILDLSVAQAPGRYLELLTKLAREPLYYANQTITLAAPVDASGADGLLLDGMTAILDGVGRRPHAPALTVLCGARGGALTVTGPRGGRLPAALTLEEADADAFPLLRRPPLWINVEHPLVAAARRAAAVEPTVAAALLARAVLAEGRRMDDDVDDDWLERAAERVPKPEAGRL